MLHVLQAPERVSQQSANVLRASWACTRLAASEFVTAACLPQ